MRTNVKCGKLAGLEWCKIGEPLSQRGGAWHGAVTEAYRHLEPFLRATGARERATQESESDMVEKFFRPHRQ